MTPSASRMVAPMLPAFGTFGRVWVGCTDTAEISAAISTWVHRSDQIGRGLGRVEFSQARFRDLYPATARQDAFKKIRMVSHLLPGHQRGEFRQRNICR